MIKKQFNKNRLQIQNIKRRGIVIPTSKKTLAIKVYQTHDKSQWNTGPYDLNGRRLKR